MGSGVTGYDNVSLSLKLPSGSARYSSHDLDDTEEGYLVITPSEDSQDLSPDNKAATMLRQWDLVLASINKLTMVMKKFHGAG